MRSGTAQLPLHTGKAPRWLFQRMVRLSREIVGHIVTDYGPTVLLERLSDPFWFQALGCVLGFDWHSSGVTTTTCGAIKEGIRGREHELGFYAAGGKGGTSRKTPAEIMAACEHTGTAANRLVHASRMSAKVDSAGIQDGYQLYHHAFFFSAQGHWCVVQQGMHDTNRMARRYHWLGDHVHDFVCEPHEAICCDARHATLNLVARESDPCRNATTAIARQHHETTLQFFKRLPTLVLPRRHAVMLEDVNPKYLSKILLTTYEDPPADFATLLATAGVGAKTMRALTLVAEIIHGTPASMRDPARFSFAHGGKDGTPFPVDCRTYDQTIDVLHDALRRATVEPNLKDEALRRLGTLERTTEAATGPEPIAGP